VRPLKGRQEEVQSMGKVKSEVENLRWLANTLKMVAQELDEASHHAAQAFEELDAALTDLENLDVEGLEAVLEWYGLQEIEVGDIISSVQELLDDLRYVESGLDELRGELLGAASEIESKVEGG